MTAGPGYDAVLLAGFGGPESADEVMPFLRTVTRGRGVPDERLVEVSHHYQALGGASPINEQNRALRAALEAELEARGVVIPVLWGNRNSAPWMADVVAAAGTAGYTRLLGLATSAYSSYSSCRQYREDFGSALASTGLVGRVQIDKVRPYFDQPGFLEPFADGTRAAVTMAVAGGVPVEEIEVVFTTHSVPSSMADTSGSATLGDHGPGGAYVAQHRAACGWVMAQVELETGEQPLLAARLPVPLRVAGDALAGAGHRRGDLGPARHAGARPWWWCRSASSPITSRWSGISTTRPRRPRRTPVCISGGSRRRAPTPDSSRPWPTW